VATAIVAACGWSAPARGQTTLHGEIDRRAAAIEQEMLAWRRHLHQHPELSNREAATSKYVAERLRSFGLEPQTYLAADYLSNPLTAGGSR
jgi:hypothetical protein